MEINLTKIDEVFYKVKTEPHIENELYDFFSFIAPNSSFRRNGKFFKNIKTSLYNRRTKLIYIGLFPYIEFFARKHSYTVQTNYTPKINNIPMDFIKEFSKSLNLHTNNNPIFPHEHQLLGIQSCITNKRLLLLSPTSSGKSLILYILIRLLYRRMKEKNQKIFLIVPTINLVTQMYNDFVDYSSHNGWNVENHCHKIFGGQEKLTSKTIIITTWQSLQNAPPMLLEGAGAVFGDEAHTCTAKVLKTLLEHCKAATYRIGMTGTLSETNVHKLVLEGLFGLVYQPITTKELIDRKLAAKLKIYGIVLKHSYRPTSYQDELEYLVFNPDRNRYICKLAYRLKKNTLVLFRFVKKHGEILKSMLDEMNADSKKKIYFVSGKTDKDIREEIRTIVEKETDSIIVASYGTWSTGNNLKNLHNIIFAHPSKGRIRVAQSIGRGLRLHPEKISANLFDLADDLRHNHTDEYNHTLRHFLLRLKLYDSEGFDYKLYNVRIGK